MPINIFKTEQLTGRTMKITSSIILFFSCFDKQEKICNKCHTDRTTKYIGYIQSRQTGKGKEQDFKNKSLLPRHWPIDGIYQ